MCYCFFYFITALLFSLGCKGEVSNHFLCKIEGKVVDRFYSKELLLIKEGGDERFPLQKVPIVNGCFSFKIEFEDIQSYELVFKDEMDQNLAKPIVFFAEPGLIKMELYPMRKHRFNIISGTPINAKFYESNQLINKKFPFWLLDDSLNAAEVKMKSLKKERDLIISEKTNCRGDSVERVSSILKDRLLEVQSYSDSLEEEYEEMYKNYLVWIVESIKKDSTILGLRDMYKLLRIADRKSKFYLPISTLELKTLFLQKYKPKFPVSFYSTEIESYLSASQHIYAGAKFIEFEAEDFVQRRYLLSELLAGKVTIVYFWASWCLPCRRKGMELIQLYNDFQAEELNIVGVAREKSLEDAISAAKADGYPWLNLVDINDKNNIWDKYGMKNSSGDIFLFDKYGRIVTYSVSVDELRAILKQYL